MGSEIPTHSTLHNLQSHHPVVGLSLMQLSGRLYAMFGVPIDSRGISLHRHGPQAHLSACCGPRLAIWPLQQVLKLHVHCQCWCIAQQRRSLMQLSGGLYATFGVPINVGGGATNMGLAC